MSIHLKPKFVPSYQEYREILKLIKETGKLIDYRDVTTHTESFIILRHDVEFSIERAFELSLIESEMHVSSSFFFQLTNNAYNVLSKKNLDMLRQMKKNGHFIGLHFHLNGLTDLQEIRGAIKQQAEILSKMVGFQIDRFSFHRPTKEVLQSNVEVEGLINVYNSKFFTFTEDIGQEFDLNVKYIADSQHRWNYGVPNKETFEKFKKIHVLTHPYSWTRVGLDNLTNFKTLLKEKGNEIIQTIDSECKHFRSIKDEL